MAFFGSKAMVAAASPAIQIPVAAVPTVERAGDAYSEIAAEIGLVSPALVKNRIMAWLADNQIKVYDLSQVREYIAQQVGNGGRLNWVPLRESDAGVSTWHGWTRKDTIYEGMFNISVYALPVPLHAIRLVRDMEAAIGKESLAFHVSQAFKESEAPFMDPFLSVVPRSNSGDLTIIDMWDEPGFGK